MKERDDLLIILFILVAIFSGDTEAQEAKVKLDSYPKSCSIYPDTL